MVPSVYTIVFLWNRFPARRYQRNHADRRAAHTRFDIPVRLCDNKPEVEHMNRILSAADGLAIFDVNLPDGSGFTPTGGAVPEDYYRRSWKQWNASQGLP